MWCLAWQPGPLGVGANVLNALSSEKQLAQRSQVQGCSAADQIENANQRMPVRSALKVNDFVLIANAEIDRFANRLVQVLHKGQRDSSDVDPGLDDVTEFQQANAERVCAGVMSLNQAGMRHRRQNTVRRGGV